MLLQYKRNKTTPTTKKNASYRNLRLKRCTVDQNQLVPVSTWSHFFQARIVACLQKTFSTFTFLCFELQLCIYFKKVRNNYGKKLRPWRFEFISVCKEKSESMRRIMQESSQCRCLKSRLLFNLIGWLERSDINKVGGAPKVPLFSTKQCQ